MSSYNGLNSQAGLMSHGAMSGYDANSSNRPGSRGAEQDFSGGMDDEPLSLELATFQAPDFNVARIVGGLTDGLVAQSKQDGGAFDPKPFIDALEAAVDQLIPLRHEVTSRTNEYEAAVKAAERRYSTKVKDLRDNFTAVTTGFQNLETRITEVGRATVRVGDELETLDSLRTRASEARDIITYYYEFAKGDLTRIEALRKEGRQGRSKVAIIARRLANVAREIEDVEGGEATREAIDKYCERFETDMLKLFDKYYRKGDPKMMAHCAKVLLDFNGGQSCVQIYVNQHDFFISKDKIDTASVADTPIWDILPDPDAPAPKSERALDSLYDEIRLTVDQEGKIITAVFPHPPVVMQVFIQRVFAQVVQSQIERLVEVASSSSPLALLRVLYLARASTHNLIEDLKQLDFFRTSGSSASRAIDKSTSVLTDNPTAATATSSAAVSLVLDAALEELFAPHLDKYIEREQRSLTELYAAYLARFTKWHRLHSKAKMANSSSVFDRMVNQITNSAQSSSAAHAASSAASAVTDQGAKGLKQLMKLGGITMGNDKRRESGDNGSGSLNSSSNRPSFDAGQGGTLVVTDKDGEIRLEVAERMLRWHAEAVGRMLELSQQSDSPRNAIVLAKILGDTFGQAYLETALDTAISLLATWDGKTEPPIENLRVLRETDAVVQLWQRYVTTALTPLTGNSLAMRREMAAYTAGILTRIENKVNELLQKAIDTITTWLSTLLGRQKKNDFRPRTDANLFETERTEPCAQCCTFITRVRDIVSMRVTGKNQEGLLTEIGIIFHSLLLEHFKKFPVGDTGTILLTKDLAAYQDAMNSFAIPAITERFEMLRQLGKLFEVQVEALKSFLDGEHLSRIDRKLLRPYIQLRSDYERYPKRTFDQIFGETTERSALGKIADTVIR